MKGLLAPKCCDGNYFEFQDPKPFASGRLKCRIKFITWLLDVVSLSLEWGAVWLFRETACE